MTVQYALLFWINEFLVVIFFTYIFAKWYSDVLYWDQFAFHPFLMALAFGILTPIASTIYAIGEYQLKIMDHMSAKYTHALLHFVAVVLGGVGIADMYKVHATTGHWMSIHSWLGIWVYACYVVQFLTGAYLYLISDNKALKGALMPYHRSFGKFLTITVIWIIVLGQLSYMYRGDNTGDEEIMWKVWGVLLFSLALAVHLTLESRDDDDDDDKASVQGSAMAQLIDEENAPSYERA